MTRTLTTVSLGVAGSLLLLIGTGHLFMPEWGYAPSAVAGMSDLVEDHFYHLGTYAIGSFLMALGIMSLIHARHPGSETTRAFASIMVLVWVARVALELRFPVRLEIFVLDDPHPVLAPILLTIALCYAAAAWGSWRARSPC